METIASFRVPGIYNNVSNEAYHQGPGISRSALMAFRKSPYHYWYKYKNPDYVEEPPTSTQVFGNAFHSFILEPQKFASQFYILPKFDKRTKAGLERWQQIQREQANKSCLTQEQYQVLQHMAESLKQNGLASKLITNSQIEQSLYWNDLDTGLFVNVARISCALDWSLILKRLKMAVPGLFPKRFMSMATTFKRR